MAAARGTAPTAVAIGTIVNTHGIRGELRVRPHNPETAALRPGVTVTLARGSERTQMRVAAVRPHKRVLLVTLEGVDSANAAEALVGCEVEVPIGALPDLPSGAVYHFALVGMNVVTVSGKTIGTVREVFTTAANDVCVVRDDGDREVLVPFVADVVKEVDVAAGRLVIDPIPGLLD